MMVIVRPKVTNLQALQIWYHPVIEIVFCILIRPCYNRNKGCPESKCYRGDL